VPAPSDPARLADDNDTPMTGIYIGVVAVEAVILVLLWILGRIYS
jgi:hypothetical protein